MKLTIRSLGFLACLLGLFVGASASPRGPRSMIRVTASTLRGGDDAAATFIPDPHPKLILPDPVPAMKWKWMPVSREVVGQLCATNTFSQL